MDALLIAFFLNLIVEFCGRTPVLYRILAQRYGASSQVFVGMVLAIAVNAVIGAWAGWWIAAQLTPEARNLFLALALAIAGIGLFWTGRRLDDLAGWKIGALLTSFLGLFILGLGESPSFLTGGVAAARADPVLAGIGGAVGGVAGSMLGAALARDIAPGVWKMLRFGFGGLLLLVAFGTSMSALRLY